jgi:undecaprenyl diphosphate synthase
VKSKKFSNNINNKSLPKHVAIIMDGNGRWAEARGLPRVEGHRLSRRAIKDTIIASAENGVKVLSLFAFSQENWKRPRTEIFRLFRIFSEIIREELPSLIEEGVKVILSGDTSRFPKYLKETLSVTMKETEKNKRIILNICIGYSGKDDIILGIKHLMKDKIREDNVTEDLLDKYLYTHDLPPVDLLIRTSGEQRISNFMLWQIAYAELYFTEILWPDFTKTDLNTALTEFSNRNRRFGRIK